VTFRTLAILTLAAGTAALASALALLGEAPGASPESAHLRRMKERTSFPPELRPVTMAGIVALPHGLPLRQRAGIENRGVSIEGWNQRLLTAGDGDVHLEIAAAPRSPDSPDTAYVTAEVTARWRLGHPGWSYERLVEVFRPNRGGVTRWDSGPRRVRISGWLLYDYQYDRRASAWSLEHGSARVSGWEIHPVTRIETWDDARGAWAEVPR
jgi:hypothetical protein